MDLKQLHSEIEKDEARLIDVRELDEWNEEHFACAHLLPLSKLLEGNIPLDLPTDKQLYIHCRKGGRALRAVELLKSKYPMTTAITKGFDELKTEGFLTTK